MAHGYSVALNGSYMSFEDFLDSDEFRIFSINWEGPEEPSLMDVIGAWVSYGEGTHACGSYETFLVTVLRIVEEWMHNRSFHRDQFTWSRGETEFTTKTISTYCGPEPEAGETRLLVHDSINRTLWELVAADNRSRDRRYGVEELQNPLD